MDSSGFKAWAATALLLAVAQGESITVTWAKWEPADSLEKLSRDFTKASGIEVKLNRIPWENFEQAAFDHLASKSDKWDVLIGDSQWLGRSVQQGYYLNLTEWIVQSGADTHMTESSMRAYAEYPKGRKSYWALPLEGDALACAYRKDLFQDKANKKAFKKKYGRDLAPPETFEDLLRVARFFGDTAQRKNPGPGEKFYGIAGYGASKALGLSLTTSALIWNHGGSLGDPATFELRGHLDHPGTLRGIEAARELFQLYPPGFSNAFAAEVNNAYNTGLAAIQINFIAFFPELMADWSKYSRVTGFFPFPGARGADGQANHYTALGGQGASVLAHSKRKEAAMKWMDWFAREETQKKWARMGGFTCDTRVLRSKEFLDATPYNVTLAISLGMARDVWAVPEYSRLMNGMEEILTPYVTQGSGSARETAQKLLAAHGKIFKAAGYPGAK
jgi:multiple sugar transport system substrate-binding protein